MPSKSLAKMLDILYDSGSELDVKPGMKAFLKRMIGLNWDEIVWDGTITAPGLEKNSELLGKLKKYVSSQRISTDPAVRLKHSMGCSSLEIVRAKNGQLPEAVDVVISPLDRETEELISGFSKDDILFSIYGGGTSVTGGIKPRNGRSTITIDTSNLKDFRLEENIAICGSGLTGVEIEKKLNAHGRTLGFFPESIHSSTVGGWIATRATGQESNQYGDIEDILLGARVVNSGGEIKDPETPRSSIGMSAKDIALGSEGTNGLILSAYLETRPYPKNRYFSTRMFRSFGEAVKQMSNLREFPTVFRVMDEVETELSLYDLNDRTRNFLRRYLGLRGIVNGSLAIIVNNDSNYRHYIPESVWLGRGGAARWFNTRFDRPKIANALWKRGVISDTLETSCRWDCVTKIHASATSAFHKVMRETGSNGMIMAHLSHQYHSGVCIYFTFLMKSQEEEKSLLAVREAIEETILSNEGSITHHHGLGSYFTKYVDNGLKKLQSHYSDVLFSPVSKAE